MLHEIVIGEPASEQQLRHLKHHSNRISRYQRKANRAITEGDFEKVFFPPTWHRLWVRNPAPHGVVTRYHLEPRSRQWVIDGQEADGPDSFVHLFDQLTTDPRVPGELVAVTYCGRHYLKALEILGRRLNGHMPCLGCLAAVQRNGSTWNTLNGSTFGAVNTNSQQRGKYISLRCFQHLEVPSDPSSYDQWANSIIAVAGESVVQCLPQILQLVGASEAAERELTHSHLPSLVSRAPDSFHCIRCGKEQFFAELLEYLHGPTAMGPHLGYPRAIDLLRVGPSMLCNTCRRKTYGSRYRNPIGSRSLTRILQRYMEFHGNIPELKWSQRPILHSVEGRRSHRRSLQIEQEAIDIAIRMPNVRAPEFMEQRRQGGSLWWILLERAGLVETVRNGPFGIQAIADDGHHCLSLLEWRFCNALSKSEIEHAKEPMYVHWRKIRADFRVGDLLIEIAGLSGREAYDDKLSSKLTFARAENIRVLVLNESDIARIDALTRITIEDLEDLWRERRPQTGMRTE